jgi:hypothetical protein
MRRLARVSFFLSWLAAAACGSSGSGGDSDSGDGGDPGGGSGGRGGSSGNAVCVPGSTQECVGPGACPGGQSCFPDGSAWGACNCQGTGGVSGSGGTGSPTGGSVTGGSTSGGGGSGSGLGGTGAAGTSGGAAGSGGSTTVSDRGEVHWRLNGSEVASGQLENHTGTNMFFAGSHVSAYVVTLATGTFACDVLPQSGTRFTMNTVESAGVNFSDLPARWRGLSFTECNAYMIPDVTTTTLRVTRWDDRAVGTFDMTITGAGDRAGDTMVLSGSFDVRVVLQQ